MLPIWSSAWNLSCKSVTATQVLGTYRMNDDAADIIETGAGQGNGHYAYLQVRCLCGLPIFALKLAGMCGLRRMSLVARLLTQIPIFDTSTM